MPPFRHHNGNGRHHWFDSRDVDEGDIDETLRRIGRHILSEPIPERLREALHRSNETIGDGESGGEKQGHRRKG